LFVVKGENGMESNVLLRLFVWLLLVFFLFPASLFTRLFTCALASSHSCARIHAYYFATMEQMARGTKWHGETFLLKALLRFLPFAWLLDGEMEKFHAGSIRSHI
jgi:hypothetical protein